MAVKKAAELADINTAVLKDLKIIRADLASQKAQLSKVLQGLQNLSICPISKATMQDPVLASDGCTYERGNITKWMKKNGTSPVTGYVLENRTLTSNMVVQTLVQLAGN